MPLPEPASADTTPPAAPTLTASDLESAAITGTTLHYRAGGNGGFTVTAAADADVARVDFSALGAGWFGGGSDATAPFTAAYGFSLASVAPFPLTAVASDAAGNASAPARLNVVGDGAGPTVTLTCEPDECTGQISLSAADGGSGVARLLYSVDGSEPTTPYEGTPFLATTEMPLRRARSTVSATSGRNSRATSVRRPRNSSSRSVRASTPPVTTRHRRHGPAPASREACASPPATSKSSGRTSEPGGRSSATSRPRCTRSPPPRRRR